MTSVLIIPRSVLSLNFWRPQFFSLRLLSDILGERQTADGKRDRKSFMKTAFLYSDEFAKFDYGPSHPLKTLRLKLTYELVDAYGLLSLPHTRVVVAEAAEEKDALLFHDPDYLRILQASNDGIAPPGASRFGIGPGDNPAFKGLYRWSMLVLGASLQATAMVAGGETDIAFNMAGGLHHALPARASGFCYINDPVIAIMSLLKKGRRVAYVDIDAHHADGVQAAFYKTDRVLTISLHETGTMLFPGTGFAEETGEGAGKGYCVNVPMPPYSDDELFLYAFDEVVPPMLARFAPDVVVSQLGVDSFRADPLAHLNYTTYGFCEAVKRIKRLSPKWVALGGGGYDVARVARAWTLAWAIMNDAAIPDEIPEGFLSSHPQEGFGSARIRDERYAAEGTGKKAGREEVERVVRFVRKKVFPLVGL
jgi:acetoin utilization protein AcuC